MKTRYSLPLVVFVLLKYATTTTTTTTPTTTSSISQQINPHQSHIRPMIVQQPTVYSYYQGIENDQQEDIAEDADSSPSELIETHAFPETPDSDDSVGPGGGNVGGVQRVRRRRRRRRRKRPKAAAMSATSPATAEPVNSSDGLDAYYTLPADEIRRKPFKYRGAAENTDADADAPQVETYGAGDGYSRRRVTKRRRRPLKRPIDDDPSFDNSDDSWTNTQNNDNDHDKPTPAAVTTTTTTTTTTSPRATTRTADPPKLTAVANRNKLPPSPSKQDDLQSLKVAIAVVQEDLDNSLKRRKRPAVQKTHHENDAKNAARDESSTVDVRNAAPQNQQHKAAAAAVEENVVVKVRPEDTFKSVETRKEFFKLRRLPPTSVILGHAKFRPSATTKSEAAFDKSVANRNNSSEQQNTAGQRDESIAARIRPSSTAIPTSSANDPSAVTVGNNSATRESNVEQRPAAASSETPTLGLVQVDENNATNESGAGDRNEENSPGASFQYPIIAYTGQQQRLSDVDVVNSNASAFLSANDQRLAIIYVPCNQTVSAATADKIFKNGGAFLRRSEENLAKSNGAGNVDEPQSTESTAPATRKISTTRLPSTQLWHPRESASVARLENDDASSTAQPTTTISSSSSSSSSSASLSPQSSSSVVSEKFVTVGSSTTTASALPYAGREPKRYHDDIISKSKFESAKEEQAPTSQIRKPYPSPVLNPTFVKPFAGSSKEIFISYTSTTNSPPPPPPSLFSYHNVNSADEQISLQLKNHNNNHNDSGTLLHHRNTFDENTLINRNKQQHHHHHQVERKKLPLAVKSVIIISGAILALAVLGFFALLLSCKIRQAKSRMKCHRELYRDQFQSNEFRQSSRSTSPVMSKSNYNTRNFANNVQPTATVAEAASNRNYYLWQTLRKTFQYD